MGGDFMHARLLLPSLFTMLVPIMMWRWRVGPGTGWRKGTFVCSQAVLLLAVLVWSIVCGLWLRVPYRGGIGADGLSDEPSFYANLSGRTNPVEPDDYIHIAYMDSVRLGRRLEAESHGADRTLELTVGTWPLAEWPHATIVSNSWTIGLVGYTAGPDVYIADHYGLADAFAARLRVPGRGRPGHHKNLPVEWIIARFAAPAAIENVFYAPRSVAAARRALDCSPLSELHRAITEPMGVSRFIENLVRSAQLTVLAIPADAGQAEATFCRSA
jgi:arabinofuranosyltransferase